MKIPKLKPKAFKIDLGVYPYTIFVCFMDLDKLVELIRTEKYPPSEKEVEDIITGFNGEGFAAKVLQLNNGNILMYIENNFIDQSYMVNAVTHEVFHITHMIMDRIGLKLGFKSDEAFCYLNGYINEKIFEQI